MTLVVLRMLAPAHLEDGDFVAAPVREDRCRDTCPCNHGLSQTHACPVSDHQYLIENDFRAHLPAYLFNLEFFAGGNLVLLADGLYDRVHRNSKRDVAKKDRYFKTLRSSCQRLAALPKMRDGHRVKCRSAPIVAQRASVVFAKSRVPSQKICPPP